MEPSEVADLLKAVLRRPIAYHRAFCEIAGKVSAGLMLSQAWYWTQRAEDNDGWFYKTREEWREETGMSRTEQETARRRLVERGLFEEKLAGMPAKMHFRVNMDRLISLLAENPPTGKQKSYQQAGKVPASTEAGNPPTPYIDPETTQKSTTEIDIDVVLKNQPNNYLNAVVVRWFEFWQKLFADVPTVDTSDWKLTLERRKHMLARARSDMKWTERQGQEALRGMRITPHNLGKNEAKQLYIDPTTCFRNDTRLDKYRQTWLDHERSKNTNGATGKVSNQSSGDYQFNPARKIG